MKKIAIVTIDDTNLGNRLQNYAVQQELVALGGKPETLRHSCLMGRGTNFLPIRYCVRLIQSVRKKIKNRKKINIYSDFRKKITWSKYYLGRKREVSRILNKYDYILVGSDQVWNTNWYGEQMFLSFVPPEKRVSYAASFGITSIPEDKRAMVRENLLKFKAISVREEAGAKIVKELTGRDATVLVDPTLMLDKEEWIKIEKKPRRVDFSKPYILTYFLGQKTERMERDVKKQAGKNGLQVFNLMDKQEKALYATGPGEFIYLVHHATLVMTDSFHACVFSFLFGKPFLLYERVGSCDMMSRMDTLFDTFDLRRKYVDSGLPNAVLECDYSVGYKNLERERKKAIEFLKNALEL